MTYILTWNKDKWPESELQKLMDDFAAGKDVTIRWKCASHRQCNIGDRIFLSRVGQQLPGLIGSGKIISDAYQDDD
ncbi:hypothetical protein [Methylomonas koyamae]|uniref:hypothetical protein n=1 Tax=Methylomonas koyamae TaxID=702114 RepID=UPI0006D0D3D0|nr:hypothetical protein [Methylomonas koyamae]BBL57591.1 hypothetical protein MKFW12EY_12040 [Methylomonas koyamae]